MKKLLAILSLVAIMATPIFTSANNAEEAPCIQPKGELLGQIHQLEAQGFTLASIDCQQIFYFVQPTPPYANRVITVKMQKIICPPWPQAGPCILQGTATFTAQEVVQNNQGTTRHTNLSQVFIAL